MGLSVEIGLSHHFGCSCSPGTVFQEQPSENFDLSIETFTSLRCRAFLLRAPKPCISSYTNNSRHTSEAFVGFLWMPSDIAPVLFRARLEMMKQGIFLQDVKCRIRKDVSAPDFCHRGRNEKFRTRETLYRLKRYPASCSSKVREVDENDFPHLVGAFQIHEGDSYVFRDQSNNTQRGNLREVSG